MPLMGEAMNRRIPCGMAVRALWAEAPNMMQLSQRTFFLRQFRIIKLKDEILIIVAKA